MSTLPSQARLSPNWKEEVNQRIAAHKNRKSNQVPEQGATAPERHASSNRAAAAAARVAARFAKAPSYSEILEKEARAAVRAAEAVSRAALQAQAVAESVLAELQAAKAAQPQWQFNDDEEPVGARYGDTLVDELHRDAADDQRQADDPQSDQAYWEPKVENTQSYEIRWEPDAPMLRTASPAISTPVEYSERNERYRFEQEVVEVVEPAQPIHANLIEFPREIVATRKARPRRAEGPYAQQQQHEVQLSIFEVEPEAISIDPVAADAMNPTAAPDWMSPEWSGMELDEHPVSEMRYEPQSALLEEPVTEYAVYRGIDQAPLTLRLMAAVVDGSLMLAASVLLTFEIVSRVQHLPGMRMAEIGAAAGIFIVSALYLVLFSALEKGTLGMRYAHIALCTFDGELPTRRIRFQRLAALLISVLPVGVGVLWSIFDEDHLSWHDRLSNTYLRAY